MKKFKNYVEKKAEGAEVLSICKNFKLIKTREAVAELLGLIRAGGIFEEYTLHDITHIDKMLEIIEWLIPKKTRYIMTSSEWLMLTLAVYFHDMGMLVSKKEYEERDSTDFVEYKREILSKNSTYSELVKDDDKFLYQEFVRENHAKRIGAWIAGKTAGNLGKAKDQFDIIQNLLSQIDEKFVDDLAMICESHHRDDIDDLNKYDVDTKYGDDPDEKVNLNYIAIILRCADLLHITQDRTPSISRRIINISNPYSVLEWEKQRAVKAVKPLENNTIDENGESLSEEDTIAITAYFKGADTAEAYFGLSSYLQYAQKEIARCNAIAAKAQMNKGAKKYYFPWKKIDESSIKAVGFEPKKLRFSLDQESILQLLVGHTLYNDPSVVVRELIQNAIDAVKLQKEIDQRKKRDNPKEGKVLVSWDENNRILSFIDNGTGMTISDIENYLLKVGASKYRDELFAKEFPDFISISHFGIGILTCFLVADNIDIITNSGQEKEANVINLRNVHGSYLLSKLEKDEIHEHIKEHGTKIDLHVRSDADMTELENSLRKWIMVPDVPVYLSYGNDDYTRIGFDTIKDAIIEYFKSKNIEFDDKRYKVFVRQGKNIDFACALRYEKFYSDWSLMKRTGRIHENDEYKLPIGICVEGIRVEFTTPGYKNAPIYAIANIKNGSLTTNVVRSALEYDASNQGLKDIYSCYKQYLQEQMDNLTKSNSFAWAISENNYLMSPLLNSNGMSEVKPISRKILIESLAELKCVIIENDGKRSNVSASYIRNLADVSIIESHMTYAVEALLKEVRSNTSAESVIKIVSDNNNFLKGVKNLICNYDHNNDLHRYSLQPKEPSSIQVNQKQRIIHLNYKSKQDLWDKYYIAGGNYQYLFVPQKDFLIDGLNEEIGVKTSMGIFLRSDTEFCHYIKKIIPQLLGDKSENKLLALSSFLSKLFSSSILERVINKNEKIDYREIFEHSSLSFESNEVPAEIWDKIEMNEFKEIVLSRPLTLFSINNWSRYKYDWD